MGLDLLIRNGRICTEDAPPFTGSIGIKNGLIDSLYASDVDVEAKSVIDAKGHLIMPGMIDPHVHVGHGNPHAEEFWSEGGSALVGGVTTILTYYRRHPFNYLDLVPELIRQGEESSPIDFAVHLGLFVPQNLEELEVYYERFGIVGLKFFPGLRDDDPAVALKHTGPMAPIDDNFVLEGFRKIARLPGAVALYHAENYDLNTAGRRRVMNEGRSDLAAWCDTRPDYGEAHSVRDAMWWQRLTGCPVYIVHQSSAVALESVMEERRRGALGPIYVETCPQFLTFTKDVQMSTIGKMSPPFRAQADCERLWEGISKREVDTIASDHGAFLRSQKKDAWSGHSGFPGMATILPALMTYGVKGGRISVMDVVRIFSSNTARIFGLYPRKGSLQPGTDADVIVVDPERPRIVDARDLRSHSDFSVYEGQTLVGWPSHVVASGRLVIDEENFAPVRGAGRYLRREEES